MMNDLVKTICFNVEEVYKNSYSGDLCFIIKKENGIPKFLSKHSKKYYGQPCYMFHSFADSGPRLESNKKTDSDIKSIEIVMSHSESTIYMVILIKKNGKKIIDYIDDNLVGIRTITQ